LQDLLGNIPFNVAFQQLDEPSALAEHAITVLKNVYDGKGASGNITLGTEHLSDYFRRVIEVARLIPVGYVSSYGAVANVAGGSPRAVGHVMASNPFAPIVPCHRVVAADFTLGGYGGGLDAKRAFLDREKRGCDCERMISVNGKSLAVFPVERVLRRAGKE
jgi:methylated-DNA-[protein]-cysteine S-methyltransferase